MFVSIVISWNVVRRARLFFVSSKFDCPRIEPFFLFDPLSVGTPSVRVVSHLDSHLDPHGDISKTISVKFIGEPWTEPFSSDYHLQKKTLILKLMCLKKAAWLYTEWFYPNLYMGENWFYLRTKAECVFHHSIKWFFF